MMNILDYESELRRNRTELRAAYTMPDGNVSYATKARFMAPEIFGFSTPNTGNAQYWQCDNASTVQWNVQSLLSKVSTQRVTLVTRGLV